MFNKLERFIYVEDVLEELIGQIPPINSLSGTTTHKPTFLYGQEVELTDHLANLTVNSNLYPLIWMVQPYTESHTRKQILMKDVVFIFAVSTNTTMSNKERLKVTYKKILVPLMYDFFKCLKHSTKIDFTDNYELYKFPKYMHQPGKNKTLSVWDALKVKVDININANNIIKNTINFN